MEEPNVDISKAFETFLVAEVGWAGLDGCVVGWMAGPACEETSRS